MNPGPQKHMGYFDCLLLEALQKAKLCALCELEARSTRRYLDNLLYENVNDLGVRGALAWSRGGIAVGTRTCSWSSATAWGRPSCTATR